jgi:hypothetical protein
MTSNEQEKKPKNNVALAIIEMPDGKEHEIPLPPKTFSSGREGYYAQIYNHLYMIMRYTVAKYKYGKRRINENKKYYKN